MDGKSPVILLGGGDKRRQAADIAAAVGRWQRYKKAKA
jgi:putative component of toxin-antitoxin plasmid stabilization module